MLFARPLARFQMEFQKRWRLGPKPSKRVLDYMSQNKETVEKIEKHIAAGHYITIMLGGAFFFVMGLLSLFGIIRPRQQRYSVLENLRLHLDSVEEAYPLGRCALAAVRTARLWPFRFLA